MRQLLCSLLIATVALASRASGAKESKDPKATQIGEYRLKAEFIERFTHFVKWPDGKPDPARRFVLCVIGEDPFGESLRDLARERKIDDRRIELRTIHEPEAAATCQLLFIATSESRHLDQILAATRHAPVLTVGDTDGYANRGVDINLFVADAKIGFEINERAARESGIELSAKLLKLARLVGEGS